MNRLLTLVCLTPALFAEVRTMTLRETVATALRQNPEALMARYDQARAQAAIQVARDPFIPKVYAGSGAAWNTGYPSTINGNPPAIFQAQMQMSLYNRPQTYRLAQAREKARAADIDTSRQADEAAYRAASLWLDAQQTAEAAGVARRQIEHLRSLRNAVAERLKEGRALAVDLKQADFDIAKAEQRAESLSADQESAELSLAVTLGFGSEDRIRAASEDRITAEVPASEDATVDDAIGNSKDIRVLQSHIQAKELEIREYKSTRWPTIDLVARYDLLARYNFQDFFVGTFQRHNGQLGAAFTLPVLVGTAARGYMSQSEADLAKLRAQVNQMRGNIALNTRKNFQLVRKAVTARAVARLDLDLTRERLSVLLAQYEEGRTGVREVEQTRIAEDEKWMTYYEAQHNLEQAKLNLLRQAGTLVAALQ